MAYIAAQGPLPETAEDFWRMLWEHNSTIVVMLTKLKEMGKEKCTQYWPDTRSVRYQYYVVDPVAEYNMPQYKLREFKVKYVQNGFGPYFNNYYVARLPTHGMDRVELFVNSNFVIGLSKEFPNQEKDSLTSSVRFTRLRSNLDKMAQ
jgi:receptor-type tyrosine-protein phosphatase F